MSTAAALVDRTFREWLTPPSDQPARFKLNDSGGISATDTTAVTDTGMLSPEQTSLVGPGTVIEIDQEQMVVVSVSGTAPALTLTLDEDAAGDRKPTLGTAAAAHVDDSWIILAPDYARRTVYDAVADAIDDLWPSLWAVKTTIVPTSTSYVDLPSDCEEILDVRVQSGTKWPALEGGAYELLRNFPLASSTRAIQYGPRVPMSAAAIVKYKAKAARPTTESTTLAAINVNDSWQKAITAGAAAGMLRSEDIKDATLAYITETLENEGFPPGAGEQVSNSLLRYQDFLIQRRARNLDIETPPTQVVERVL